MKHDPLSYELPACDVLMGFNKPERAKLSKHGEFLVYRSGDTIIEDKCEQDALYLLLSGILQARRLVDDEIKPLGKIKAGEWFGEINIFHPHLASAEVLSHTESRVWRISRSELEAFLNEEPGLGCMLLLGIGEVLARRIRRINMTIYS